MTDGVLTAEARLEMEQLIAEWRQEAAEEQRVSFCADDLEALLSRWRSAHGSREAECTCEIDRHDFNCPKHGRRE